MFWDFVSAENSVGFHNPAKALDTLTSSITLSQDAVNAALKATNYGIAPKLEGDIKQVVPPILKMSRKLQQDPEYLKTHPWFAYLKPLPKADRCGKATRRSSRRMMKGEASPTGGSRGFPPFLSSYERIMRVGGDP